MGKRFYYSTSEDLRMLRWIARNQSLPPMGEVIWRDYVEKFRSGHTVYSLNGRMRRQIIPNLASYIKHLKLTEARTIHQLFKSRFCERARKVISHEIKLLQKRNQEEGHSSGQEFISSPTQINEDSRERLPAPSESTGNNQPPVHSPSRMHTSSNHQNSENYRRELFSFRTWNSDMKPIAERYARFISNCMSEHVESKNTDPEIVQLMSEAFDKTNLEDLFSKMFAKEEQKNIEEYVIVRVDGFPTKPLRMKHFMKVEDEMSKNHRIAHVRSAVFVFFQYFEYYIARLSTKNSELYIRLMNQLVGVLTKFLIL